LQNPLVFQLQVKSVNRNEINRSFGLVAYAFREKNPSLIIQIKKLLFSLIKEA